MAEYEFAIRKETLHSGEETLTPVCRKKMFPSVISILNKFNPSSWGRIVNIYNKYTIMDLPEHLIPDLSYSECKNHITGYQKQLEDEENIAPRVVIEDIVNFKPVKYDRKSKPKPGPGTSLFNSTTN